VIINRADQAYAFLKSACLQPPSVRVNAATAPFNPLSSNPPPSIPHFTNNAVPTLSSVPLKTSSVPAPSITLTTSASSSVSKAPSSVPAAQSSTAPQIQPTTPKPVPRKPETENSTDLLPEAEDEGKNTPSMSCARRLIRVAKKRLREGGKPKEPVKQTKMVLGEDGPTEEKRLQSVLTKYYSPLAHLGSCKWVSLSMIQVLQRAKPISNRIVEPWSNVSLDLTHNSPKFLEWNSAKEKLKGFFSIKIRNFELWKMHK